MVNATFPHDETNIKTMDMALNLLRGMANRGNTYLDSRHSLLLELQASINPNPAKVAVIANAPITPNSIEQHPPPTFTNVADNTTAIGPSEWPLQEDLPSIGDITFNLDINDDSGLWEEILGQIDIDMDTDWIENTLKR